MEIITDKITKEDLQTASKWQSNNCIIGTVLHRMGHYDAVVFNSSVKIGGRDYYPKTINDAIGVRDLTIRGDVNGSDYKSELLGKQFTFVNKG